MTVPAPLCRDIDRIDTTPYDGTVPGRWIQLGLATPAGRPGPLYPELAQAVREWLDGGLLSDFFFMHKPPGLRVRFAPAPGHGPLVRTELDRLVREWQDAGLVAAVQPGVYEPEAQLFGGPESMRHVHRLFTVDATTWLDHHALGTETPAWPLSLLMLRAVFDGLQVVGWEDRDVWARVAAAGRHRPDGVRAVDAGAAHERLRRWWEQPAELAAALPKRVRELADRHADAVRPLLRAWWTDYFSSAHAVLGPRQAAAYYVVFHWNRAGLGFGRQVLITESLARVEGAGVDVR
jgi:thiopeptide-type bacteriocin biosynthesis protein